MPVIALLFLVVPIVELVVIVYAAQTIGTPQTLLLLLVVSIVGAWLVKVEGIGVWRRFITTASRGEMPHREIVDGVLILAAGAFMLTPGFVTDVVGLLFLAPPSRAVIRALVLKRLTAGVTTTTIGGFAGGFGAGAGSGDSGVWDTTGYEADADASDRPDDDPPGLTR